MTERECTACGAATVFRVRGLCRRCYDQARRRDPVKRAAINARSAEHMARLYAADPELHRERIRQLRRRRQQQ